MALTARQRAQRPPTPPDTPVPPPALAQTTPPSGTASRSTVRPRRPAPVRAPVKGMTKARALVNLRKANAAKQQARHAIQAQTPLCTTLQEYLDAPAKTQRTYDYQATQQLFYTLGTHLARQVAKSSTPEMMKGAFPFKALMESYNGLRTILYPNGLATTNPGHMDHLLGSVMNELKATLKINLHLPTPTTSRHAASTKAPITIESEKVP